mmetsp:Transcript_11525/g.44689  ORF Transcript_11525/g.44689 Transcript_11525/m.44689 type:complete len:336 (-) Transcript_11525:473-1480(-)
MASRAAASSERSSSASPPGWSPSPGGPPDAVPASLRAASRTAAADDDAPAAKDPLARPSPRPLAALPPAAPRLPPGCVASRVPAAATRLLCAALLRRSRARAPALAEPAELTTLSAATEPAAPPLTDAEATAPPAAAGDVAALAAPEAATRLSGRAGSTGCSAGVTAFRDLSWPRSLRPRAERISTSALAKSSASRRCAPASKAPGGADPSTLASARAAVAAATAAPAAPRPPLLRDPARPGGGRGGFISSTSVLRDGAERSSIARTASGSGASARAGALASDSTVREGSDASTADVAPRSETGLDVARSLERERDPANGASDVTRLKDTSTDSR